MSISGKFIICFTIVIVLSQFVSAEENSKITCDGLLDKLIIEAENMENDAINMTKALNAIALNQAKIGLAEKAKKTFDKALTFSNKTRNVKYPLMVISSMAKSKMFKDALQRVAKLNISYQSKAVMLIANQYASENLLDIAKATFEKAVKLTEKIKNITIKSRILLEIAQAQVAVNLLDEAKRTFKLACKTKIELRFIAKAQVKAGFLEEAKQTFEDAIKNSKSAYNTCDIAEEQLNCNLISDAKKTVEIALTSVKNNDALEMQSIAILYGKLKMFDKGYKIARKVSHPTWKRTALALLNQYQIQVKIDAKEYAAAIEETTSIISYIEDYYKSKILAKIAKAQMIDGMIDDAIRTTKMITDSQVKSEILCEIAALQAQANLLNSAKKTFLAAIASAKKIGIQYHKINLMSTLAKELVNANLSEIAISMSEKVKNVQLTSQVYRYIISKHVADGKISDAVKIAEKIEFKYYKSLALTDIGLAQHKKGLTAESLKTFLKSFKFIQQITSADYKQYKHWARENKSDAIVHLSTAIADAKNPKK